MTTLSFRGKAAAAKSATEQSSSLDSVSTPSSENGPLVPGIYNPPEMRRPAKPFERPDAQTMAAAEDFAKVFDNKKSPSQSDLSGIDKLIQDYPGFVPGYFFRGMIEACYIDHPDTAQAKSDIEFVLSKSPDGNIYGDSDSKSEAGNIYALLAKIEYSNKNYSAALDLLNKMLKQKDLTNANSSLSGFSDPSSSHHFCEWSLNDIYQLEMAAPRDWRPIVLEGVFFSPQFYDKDQDEKNSQAMMAFQKAALLYPNIALIPFFQGQLVSHKAFMNSSDAAAAAANRESLQYYGKAISLGPKFEAAYDERAEALSDLKEYAGAIKDYTAVLLLDPEHDEAYADRGIAYYSLGNYRQAISDYSHALPLQISHHDNYLDTLYQNRADAYAKLREYRQAIEDYSSAIALQLEGQLVLGNISEFRSLYPEYAAVPDDILLPKLHERFVPTLKFADFKNSIINNKPWHPSFLLTDLYSSRAKAYFALGDYTDGILDIHRVVAAIPDWKGYENGQQLSGLASDGNAYFIDAKASQPNALPFPLIYLRTVHADSEDNTVQKVELDCAGHKVKSDPPNVLDAEGHELPRMPRWSKIDPDSIEENIWSGVCHGRQ